MHTSLFPLTRQQEGLWVEWKFSAQQSSYNTCVQLRLEGKIDVSRFRQAASDVVAYFDLLHAYFTEKDGKAQLAFSETPYVLEYIDLSTSGKEESESAAEKANTLLKEKRQANIDLTTFPLISAALIKTADTTFYFTGVVPHIISDGASALFFLQALSIAYNEGKEGLENTFGNTQKGWLDYLAHQHETLNEEKVQAATEYWKENLQGVEHRVDIGTQVCLKDSASGGRVSFSIPQEAVKALKKIAFQNRTSLFSSLSALFSAFITRYFNCDDMLIGYPVNLRPAGYRHSFGMFVNVLPLHVNTAGDPSFHELVKRIDTRRRSDKKHQHLPSLDIVKAKRSIDPAFDGKMFNISMAETISRLQTLDINGTTCQALDHDHIEMNDDLSFIYEISEDNIALWLEYRKACFSESQITRMAEYFSRLATAIAENPDQPIASHALLRQKEEALFDQWNTVPNVSDNHPALLHEFFTHQAQENPSQPAMVQGDTVLTYQQANERANQLAHYISSVTQGKNVPVTIIMDRSPEQLITLLAVLKAGAAYLPIETTMPVERVEKILHSSQSALLITSSQYQEKFTEDKLNIPCVYKENIEQELSTLPITFDHSAKPHDLAYIIYTSGSTGEPKGVMVSHGAVSQRIAWLEETFPLDTSDRILQHTNYSFDVSVAEIFWPLAQGATLILSYPRQQQHFKELCQLIKQQQITGTCMVPSLLSMLLHYQEEQELASFKYVLCAGEALPFNTVTEWYKNYSGTLYNVYGPTEAIIYASYSQCTKEDITVTLGKPIGNTTLYVLNSHMQQQPVGVAGELYIGGTALADGYINDSARTEERFLSSPFIDGEKIYKTGDMVRFNEQGNIEYLGRNDHQVKIRGFRIELGEIESALLLCSGIKQAAILVNQQEGRSPQLIACYSGKQEKESELSQALEQHLPSYMLPQHYIHLDSLPMMPASGKINRQALQQQIQQHDITATALVEDIVIPSTEQEKTLAAIWARILRIPAEKIGTNQSFFSLGGDSLMTMEVAYAAEKEGIYIEPYTLFQQKTIAATLAHQSVTGPDKKIYEPIEGEVPLLPRHIKFFDDGFGTPSHWNRSIMLELDIPIEASFLEESIQAVLDRHDGLRLHFKQSDGKWHAFQYSDNVKAPVDYYDLTAFSAKEQEQRINEALNKTHQSLTLDQPPLFKWCWFECGESKSILALVTHHLLVDMRSCRLLLEDLLTIFQQKMLGVPLPPSNTEALPVTIWAEALKNYASSLEAEPEEITFWQEQLQHSNDFTIPAHTQHIESECTKTAFTLSEDNTSFFIKELPAQLDMYPHEILLATFAQAYKQWQEELGTAKDDLTINTCRHGRDPLIEGLSNTKTIGWVNTVFPLSVPLQDQDIQKSVKQLSRHIPHHSLHYGILRFMQQHPEITAYAEPNVFFNYVSKIDTSLPEEIPIRLKEVSDQVIASDPNNHSCYVLSIEVGIVDNVLHSTIAYNQTIFTKESIERLLLLYKEALHNLSTDKKAISA